jgi:hypothetical protein
MTKQQIIAEAQLYLDDTTDLSSQELSDLFDAKYAEYNSRKPWEGTKKQGADTTSTSLPYVPLETDFLYLTQNANSTDSSVTAQRPVIFRGATYKPYEVVSWSDRRQYRDAEGYAYLDIPNSRIYFTKQPTIAEAVEYDYHAAMAVLANGDSPWFPAAYHPVLFHEMVVDDFIIQQSDKAKSYKNENKALAEQYYRNHCYQNARLIQM